METRLRSLVVSLALLEMVASFATAAGPAFQVVYGPAAATGTPLTDGGKVTLGVGQTTATQVVFWIKNTGTTDLTNVTVSQSLPSDYTIGSVLSGTPFSPGKAAGFTVSLNSGFNTMHKQVIHITASGLTANPYDIEINAPEVSVEQPAGTVLISDQLVAFGKLGAASPSTLTFTVKNVGSATLGSLQLGYYNNPGYNYADYTFAGLDGHIKTLAPAGSLNFTLTLKPGANTNHDAKFYIPSNDADEVPFKIHVIAPEITVEHPLGTNLIDGTASIDFSQIGGATPNTATITIKNTGSADLNGLSANITGAGAADYTLVQVPTATLAPNASTSFTVTFDPASSQGSHLANLDIVSTDADETHFNIMLKAPEIAVETTSRDLEDGGFFAFATEFGSSRTVKFTIRNKGSAPLTNLSAFISGPSAAEYTMFGPHVTTLAPNATDYINVKFTPAGPGGRSAFMQIGSNDGDEKPFDIIFQEPKIQVEQPAGAALASGTTIDFGNLAGPLSNTLTCTIRNVGNADLTDLAITRSGVDAADYTIGPLGATTLAPNATTTFTITLDPASTKTHAATLNITSNDEGSSPFVIYLKAPEITVERPAGTALVDGVSIADYGTVSTANTSTFTFTVRNRGSSTLRNLIGTIAGGNNADFVLAGPAVNTLAPGASTTFTVRFQPLSTGPRTSALFLDNNDVDEHPFNIVLSGFGMAITLHPTPKLVGVGEPASFSVAAITVSQPPVYTWLKNGVAIPGAAAHLATFTIPAVTLADAGIYSCLVVDGLVTISSGSARLGVVGSATTPMTVNQDTTITMPLARNIPPGPPPSYLWKKNGTAFGNSGVAPNQVIAGATTATVTITKAAALNDDIYTCVVGMDGLTKESGPFDVTVRLKPVINAAGPFGWFVSDTVTDAITAANAPTSFTFTNLPAGVVGNKTTGQLSGKPNTATTTNKTFTVSATNAAGTGPAATIGYTIAALPAESIGTFNGLVDRSTTLTGPVAGQLTKGHGGSLSNLVITSTGSFTATLKVEDKTYAMPAASRLEANAGGNPSASVKILRGTAIDSIPDLTLAFSINKTTGELTGTLTDSLIGSPVNVKAWRNPWHTTAPANPATALAGNYTAQLKLDPALQGYGAHPTIPQGHGYVTLTLTTAGSATWGGKLADGSVITGSTTMGPGGQVPLHVMLYTPTVPATAGSAHGWAQATEQLPGELANSGRPLLDGTIDWLKLAQLPTSTTRSYKGGFALHNLTVVGGKYGVTVPALGLIDGGVGTNNAKLTFSEGDLASSALAGPGSPAGATAGTLKQALRITSTNTIVMPGGATNNPGSVTLTPFTASTGVIGGSFALKDNDPRNVTAPQIPRTVPWVGVLVPRINQGVGQFQLPQLPTSTPPATTPTTSPMLSGKVVLEQGP